MKISILFFFGLLVGISPPVAAQEAPITNFSLYVGNTYFARPSGRGDGTARWAETRILFGRATDYRLISAGVFFNYVGIGSYLDNYLYVGEELAGGLALNFGSRYWFESNEVWGWLNAGLKFSENHGQIDQYEVRQKDKSLYFFGGLIFKNALERGPFLLKKIMVTYQKPFEDKDEGSTNHGYLKIIGENTFLSLPITRSERICLEPKIFGGFTYEFDHQTYYLLGAGISFAGEYNQQIISFEAGMKLGKEKNDILYSGGVIINLIELIKLTKKR